MKKIVMMTAAGLAIISTAFADGSISRVGAENGGSAGVSLSSTATSDIDLYDGLLFWIKDQYSIEGDKERKTTYPLSKVFDGSFSNPLAGTAIPAKDENDYTLSLSFKVGKLNRVNRLFKIGGHTIYLDENNILYYHTLKTDFVVDSTGQYYTLVLRVAGDRRLTVYAGAKGSKLYVVWSGLITGQLTFGGALAMNAFNLGYGEKPSAGYLQSGQFANIRFWTRTLTDGECERVDIWQKPDITVSDVEVFSGYPWKEVVIGYTITGKDTDVDAWADVIQLEAMDNSAKKTYRAQSLTGAELTEGRHVLRWDAASDGANFSSPNVVFSVSIVRPGARLWADGPYWAECNVGATKPEECGYYFWWGDTVGYKRNADNNGWISVKDSTSYSFSGCPTSGKNNSQLRGYIDATGNLVAAHDAATAHLGAPWRMPTDAEFSALINNCDTELTSRNGVSGRLVKGRGAYASKSIFLPAAGWGYDSHRDGLGSYGGYWSSTPNSAYSNSAWYLYFDSGGFCRRDSYRYYGRYVRPVRGFAK